MTYRGTTRVTRPESATHAAVAWSGVATMLLGVTVLNFWCPLDEIAYLALIVMACTALGIFVPDLLWQKRAAAHAARRARPAASWPRVGSRSSSGLPAASASSRCCTGCFPSTPRGRLLRQLLGRRCGCCCRPGRWSRCRICTGSTGGWRSRRTLCGRWAVRCCCAGRASSRALIGQHLLGWLVKGFFLPLMFTYFCDNLNELLHYDLKSLHDFRGIYDWAYFTLVLHRREPGLDDLPDVAAAHRHAHPLDRADGARLGRGAGVLRAVLVADQPPVHRLRYRAAPGATWLGGSPWLYDLWGCTDPVCWW